MAAASSSFVLSAKPKYPTANTVVTAAPVEDVLALLARYCDVHGMAWKPQKPDVIEVVLWIVGDWVEANIHLYGGTDDKEVMVELLVMGGSRTLGCRMFQQIQTLLSTKDPSAYLASLASLQPYRPSNNPTARLGAGEFDLHITTMLARQLNLDACTYFARLADQELTQRECVTCVLLIQGLTAVLDPAASEITVKCRAAAAQALYIMRKYDPAAFATSITGLALHEHALHWRAQPPTSLHAVYLLRYL